MEPMQSTSSALERFPAGAVQVSLEISIDSINTLKRRYTANVALELLYSDGSTLKSVGDQRTRYTTASWMPKLCTWNPILSNDDSATLHCILPDGSQLLRRSRTIEGTYMPTFDAFPFDVSTIDFTLLLDPEPIYVLKNVSVADLETEFEITGISDNHARSTFLGRSKEAPCDRFTVSVSFRRHPGFYLLNFFLITFGVVMLQCICIGVNIDDLGSRIQITLTLILTIAAHKISVASQVPKSPEQTMLDKQVLWAFIFLLTGAAENLLISFEIAEDALMVMMDWYFTWGFALFWVALNAKLASPLRDYSISPTSSAKPASIRMSNKYHLEKGDERYNPVSRSFWVRNIDSPLYSSL